jgi:endonuclease YncB( thermonuclease family)
MSDTDRLIRLDPWRRDAERRLPGRSRWRWYWRPRLRMWFPLIALITVAAALWAAVEHHSLLPRLWSPANESRHVAGLPVAGLPAQPRPFTQDRRPARVVFGFCGGGHWTNCVIDGDTIEYGGFRIRLADIDAPELRSAKCASELNRARQATQRLNQLLNEGPVQIVSVGSRDEDRYGRKLRVIERNGRSLGGILVAEGLARRWDGARRSWCG